MNTTQKFQADELVTWTTLEGQTWTRRPVAFERYTVGGRAIVTFGRTGDGTAPRRYDVPVAELSRPEPTNTPPIYHSDFIRPPEPPKPLSEQQITTRIAAARAALAEAHEDVRRCRDVTRSTGALVDRARAEHNTATAALRTLDAHTRADALKLEAALRAGQTPPPTRADGQDRAYVAQRVTMTEAALNKFQSEDQTARTRLSSAVAGIRTAAVSIITVMLEKDIGRLREMEQHALQCRADLIKITQWAGASGTALKLTEFASTVLSLPLDADSVRFLPTAAVGPWQALLERLLVDPLAELIEPVTVASEAA